MTLIATANISGELIGIIASLATLTPLVRALHKWHIDTRKTSTAQSTNTALQAQISHRRSPLLLWLGMVVMVISLASLMLLAFSPAAHPATLRDVALVGLVVTNYIASTCMLRDA